MHFYKSNVAPPRGLRAEPGLPLPVATTTNTTTTTTTTNDDNDDDNTVNNDISKHNNKIDHAINVTNT